ncbi:MAG: aminotransferase class V-fold PLP-dependent enzyme [Actinomycetia bacterium]|nr:aminotransferase class V-fold PLP-dependent enzyme [Actinomycetes bacterium]
MIYLDNAATSFPKPKEVLAKIDKCFKSIGGSPGRGAHLTSLEAGRVVLGAREAMAQLLEAGSPENIVFTANATEALNLAIKGSVRDGDTVVTTSVEHNSVCRPLEYLAEHHQVKVMRAANFSNGDLNLAHFKELIEKSPDLAVVTHASNVIGNILPIEEIAAITRKAKVPLLVDAAQTAGSVPISIEKMGVDMLVFAGHKALLGPPGTGGLYIGPGVAVRELKQGGTGGASKDGQPKIRPDRYESGTPNTWGIGGLGAAVKFISKIGVENIYLEESRKMRKLLSGLERISGIKIYGPNPSEQRVSLVSLRAKKIDSGELAYLLDKNYGIATRAGYHCAPEAHQTLGTYDTGTLRLSPGYFSTDEDIEAVVQAIDELSHRTPLR